MLVVFSPIFVADTKIIDGYNMVAFSNLRTDNHNFLYEMSWQI